MSTYRGRMAGAETSSTEPDSNASAADASAGARSLEGADEPTSGGGLNGSPWSSGRWWATTGLAALAVLVCVGLGAWQFDRARTRDTPEPGGLPAASTVALDSALPADLRVPPGSAPVSVTVTGEYDPAHQLLVPGRIQDGQPASEVVTPLTRGEGPAVLIIRGWVAAGTQTAPAPPTGEVTVTGWLVASEPLEAQSADPLALPEGQVASVTAARIAGTLPYPVVDAAVGLVSQEPAGTQSLPVVAAPAAPVQVRWSVQSLAYSIEWWFFALVGVWMWSQALRIERRRTATG